MQAIKNVRVSQWAKPFPKGKTYISSRDNEYLKELLTHQKIKSNDSYELDHLMNQDCQTTCIFKIKVLLLTHRPIRKTYRPIQIILKFQISVTDHIQYRGGLFPPLIKIKYDINSQFSEL